MSKYNVHIYREMRLSYSNIEADSPETAAIIARGKATEDADAVKDCEGENLAALVDEVGDQDYARSVIIDFEADKQRKAAQGLLTALVSLASHADEDCPAEYRSHHLRDALDDALDAILMANDCGVHVAGGRRTVDARITGCEAENTLSVKR